MKYIDIHTHQFNNDPDVLAICNLKPEQVLESDYSYLSTGIHPWDVEGDMQLVRKALKQKNLLALGEVGIDGAIETSIELQEKQLIAQLEINSDLHLPVIIHNVKGLSSLQAIKKKFPNDKWIIHGFNKGPDMAQQLLQMGCYLSFGSRLMEKSSTLEAFINTPMDAIFLETDDRSDYDIASIYKKAAELKGLELEELKKQIVKNFEKVFEGVSCGLE